MSWPFHYRMGRVYQGGQSMWSPQNSVSWGLGDFVRGAIMAFIEVAVLGGVVRGV